MANIPISNLPSTLAATANNQIPAVQNGTTVYLTVDQIAKYTQTTYPITGITSITAQSPLSGGTITSTGTIGLTTGNLTNNYLANMPSNTIKGNNTSSSATPMDLTPSQVRTMIGAGTVTLVMTGAGLSGGPITTTGTISIAPTGVTSGTYGSASTVPVLAINSQGQITSATNTNISIPSGQVTGLGTMATQNANAVAIAGGSVDGTTIGGTTPATASFTTLTATGNANFTTVASGTWNGTAIGVGYGGTGATTASGARTNLSAAQSGANSDITSLSGLTTPLSETQGGTGYGSYTTGDILYASSSSTLARLNDVATGNVLLSGGVGVAPSYGKVGLTTHVTGTLPVANGGTGLTSFTSGGAMYATSTSALTTGTLPVASGGTGVTTSTGTGSVVLSNSPTLVTPALGTPSSAVLTNATGLPLTTGVTGTLPVSNGGTGATTLTGYLVGNGTGAFTAVSTIPNAGLTNSSVTIGSTAISLGASTSTLSGLTTVTVTQDPTSALQLSTKQYVDGQVSSVSNTTYHTAVGYATTADLGSVTYNNGTSGVGATLTNAGTQAALTIDGYTFTATDVSNGTRVLVKNETTGAYNGIYVVTNQGSGSTNWVLTRSTDFNTVGTGPNYIETGAGVFVSGGTTWGSTSWVMNTTGTITVGSTALVWVQTSSSGNITVSAPITKTGNTIGLGTVGVANGGTGLTTLTAYGVLYAPTTASVGQISPSTTGYALLSTGASSAPVFGQVSLTAGVTGTLPTANGGTNLTTFTAANNAIYSTSASALTAGTLPVLAGGTGVTTSTGSGSVVLSTSPTLVTPALGTPASGVMTNVTGLPLTTGVTGTLGVTNGGTGTATAFTVGSVVFAGASGVYSQNNTKFFWDNTNNRLGANTGSPNTTLTVVSNTQTATPPTSGLPAGTDLYIMGANAANTRITQDAYGTGAYGVYTARSARGTAASPTASQSNDFLAQFTARGYGATGFGTASTGYIAFSAAENFTDTAQGTYASIYTTATGGNSATEAFRFGPAGQLGIGGATYGTSGYVLTSGGASAAPTWSQVSLTSSVTGTLPATNGGTGQSSYAVGDLLYASSTTALSRLADVATGNVLLSGGVGVAPSWGQVSLSTAVTGTLPAANGGTGNNTYTIGDLLYASGTTTLSRLADVATGSVLVSGGAGVAPSWSSTPTVSTLNYTTAVGATSETVPLVIGGTTASSALTLESTSGSGTSDYIAFKTGSQSERMRIDTSGNVGIGTTSLTSKFTVAGTGSFYTGANQASGTGYVFSVAGANSKSSSSDNNNFAIFSNDANASNPLSLAISVVGNATTANRYAYLQASEYGTGTFSTLALNPNGGNVGIGTSSPSGFKLNVSDGTTNFVINPSSSIGYIGTTASYPVAFLTNNTERMRIDTSGNVGIGTTSPSQKLQLHNGNLYFDTANYVMWDTSANWSITSDASTKLAFATGGSERMRIDSSGNVGIGTTTTSGARLTSYWTSSPQILAISSSAVSPTIEIQDGAATPNRWWLLSGLATTTDGIFSIYDKRQNVGRLNIDTSGNLIVPAIYSGTSANAANVYVNSSGQLFRSTASATASGTLIRAPQIITSGTSYTTPSNCNSIFVQMVGAGGGGGAGDAGGTYSGGSGGGGGYVEKYLAVSPSTAYTIAVGASGSGGSGGSGGNGNNGGAGGSTSITVGSTYTAPGGGAGGGARAGSNNGSTGGGGTPSTGDFYMSGFAGASAGGLFTSSTYSGTNYGFGGGGGNPGSYGAGTAGRQGVIRIWEYS